MFNRKKQILFAKPSPNWLGSFTSPISVFLTNIADLHDIHPARITCERFARALNLLQLFFLRILVVALTPNRKTPT